MKVGLTKIREIVLLIWFHKFHEKIFFKRNLQFQFSNHTGYSKGVRGQVLNDQQLAELIEGLKQNNLDNYSHIINGYIGSDGFLKQLKSTVEHLKMKNPNLTYVCDPVMGDTEPGWYVPQSLLPIYRDEILPLADVCVPNQVINLYITCGPSVDSDFFGVQTKLSIDF